MIHEGYQLGKPLTLYPPYLALSLTESGLTILLVQLLLSVLSQQGKRPV
jgi:hypothetical protein